MPNPACWVRIKLNQTAASGPGWKIIASIDIKSLDDSANVRSPATQTGDLLARLKAAGTIEAEVVRVLQDKLLLSSRLGEILTSNSLNYRAGDQLNLRLDGSDQNPVLKASPRQPGPVTLERNVNAQLNRLLPPDTALLATVTRVTAQRIEIRLAGQVLTLPRQPGIARGQLLSLQRNDVRQNIEIKPVDRKLVYKALLKHLVPAQSEPATTSMVKLLSLVNKAMNAAASSAAQATGGVSNPARAPDLTVRPAANNQAAINPVKSGDIATPGKFARPTVIDLPKPPGAAGFKQTQTEARPAPVQNSRSITALLQQVNRQTTGNPDRANAAKPGVDTARSKAGTARPETVSTGQGNAPAASSFVNATATSTAQKPPSTFTGAGTAVPVDNPATGAGVQQRAAAQAPRTSAHAASLPGANATTAAPVTLQMLLQWVPRIAELNVAQIRQWFEFASLIRAPMSKPDARATADPVRSLNRLLDPATFSRELDHALQLKIKSVAGDDATPVKTPLEMLQQYARDGARLIEQSLSQNLLQRASVGMQQETQQPLSLSLALPFLEKQDVKPIQIDLSQRAASPEDGDRGWDIRLRFEFADLGPISCHLFLEGRAVAASFYSEQDQTRNRIEQALPELEQQLHKAGFTNCEFHSFPATLASVGPVAPAGYSESLIDIEV